MKQYIILCSLLVCTSVSQAQKGKHAISIIPQPISVQQSAGSFTFNKGTQIFIDPSNEELKQMSNNLSARIQHYTQAAVPVREAQKAPASNSIVLTLKNAPDSLGDEGYILSVQKDRIVLKAHKPAGIFYGLETIYQLLPAEKKPTQTVTLPAVTIIDKPRYPWRGMMLDVSRYFYSVDFIKKYLDYMALHKMNQFHWSLTNDQGWRIEIKKHPKLTAISAWRDESLIGHKKDTPHRYDGKRHGGFYTQEQVKEIIAYARDRFITVIPEIEMPGHAVAALAAYPELSCTGGPFKVSTMWGVHEDAFCAGNEQTFQFLEDVLTEVAALFPSRLIHIGGDECRKNRWKQCVKCQARIKAEGLKDEHELQSYFIKRIENFLLAKNKNIIGWDEILEGGLAPQATVMSWRGIAGGVAAAKQHHDVIMTPESHLYFDYYQGDPGREPLAIWGYTTLEKVYSYDPTPASLTAEQARYIKGAQGNVWTEYIATPEHVEYMMMPRMAALSEVVWSQPAHKDWEDFKRRMEQQYDRYKALGINYSTSTFDVQQFVRIDSASKQAIVLMKTDTHQPEIYFTINGEEPTLKSSRYVHPFTLNKNVTIKAASFRNGRQVGRTTVQTIILPK